MSSMTGTTDLAAAPSPEAAFLDEMQQKARKWIASGTAATVIGALVLAANFGEIGVVLGCAGVGSGLFFVWFGFAWLRLLPKARVALTMPATDVGLATGRKMGVWKRSTFAELWPKDSVNPPSLAQFSETMHWAKPRYLTVDKVPAKVYGYPIAGATVVASCPDGVVVGRIKRSHLT
jgi:hypothetical protein